jgi:hypothetical protein
MPTVIVSLTRNVPPNRSRMGDDQVVAALDLLVAVSQVATEREAAGPLGRVRLRLREVGGGLVDARLESVHALGERLGGGGAAGTRRLPGRGARRRPRDPAGHGGGRRGTTARAARHAGRRHAGAQLGVLGLQFPVGALEPVQSVRQLLQLLLNGPDVFRGRRRRRTHVCRGCGQQGGRDGRNEGRGRHAPNRHHGAPRRVRRPGESRPTLLGADCWTELLQPDERDVRFVTVPCHPQRTISVRTGT